MKRIIFATIALHFIFGMNAMAQATNLNQLSKPERDSVLIALAKAATLQYAPDWYREDIVPTIEFGGYSKQEENKHRQFYTVTYYVDKTKDTKTYWIYMTQIDIWEDTGKVNSIFTGNGIGFASPDGSPLEVDLDIKKQVQTRRNRTDGVLPPPRDPSTNPYKGLLPSDVRPDLFPPEEGWQRAD